MKIRSLAAIGMLLTLPLLLSCSKNNPTESTSSNPSEPSDLTVSPTSGTPLTTVTVDGISESQATDSNLVLYFDGHPAPIFVDSLGTVTTTVPVIYDNATGWALDSTSISIALVNFKNNDTVGFGADVFSLEHLDEAPGSTIQLQSDMSRITEALHTIVSYFYDGDGEEEMVTLAFMQGLDSLVIGSDSLCLAGAITKLQNDNPDGLALLDALIGRTGMNEQTASYADIFENLASQLAALRASKSAGTASTELSDEDLAFEMQLYVVIRDFGQYVLAPTASTWSNLTGPVGLFVEIPLVAVTGAALSLIDFVTNKYIVAMLPAQIDDFTLEFAADTITLGDSTNASYHIVASNDPPPITLFDFIGQALNGIGFGSGVSASVKVKELDNLAKVLKDVFEYMMNIARVATQAYANAKPELNLDPTLASVSKMTWEADIEQSRFIELTSFTQNVIQPDAGGFNWVALGPDWDEGRVYARTTVDPSAIVIPQVSGFNYNGGAFGEDVAKTPTTSVWIKPNLVIEMTLPQNVSEVSFEPMTIRAGYEIPIAPQPYRRTGSGSVDTVWSPNVQISIYANGGTLESASGTTDASGEFTTGLRLNSGENRIFVRGSGEGDVGTKASAEETICSGSAINGPFGLVMGMPGGFKTVPGALNELRVFTTYGSCVDIDLVVVGGTVSPTSFSTDADGHAYCDITLPEGADSMIVYATATGTSGYKEYDTAVVYSYCNLIGGCYYSEGGAGTYTAIGSCTSGDCSATAAPGGHSDAEVRFHDEIQIIAKDSALWTAEAYAWFDVSVQWSISGGYSGTIGIKAELETPYSGGVIAYALNNGIDASDTFDTQVKIKVSLAPWAQTGVDARIRAGASPSISDGNTSITSSVKMTVNGISKITLADGVTTVETVCVNTGSGIPVP